MSQLHISSEAMSSFFDATETSLAILLRTNRDVDWDIIFYLENKFQWPVLQFLDNPNLAIYDGIPDNEKIIFISTIRDEKKIRNSLGKVNKKDLFNYLKLRIRDRSRFFKILFEITYEDIADIRIGQKKFLNWWQIGIIATVAVGVIGATYYLLPDGTKKSIDDK